MSDCEYYINKESTLSDELIKKYNGVFDDRAILNFHRSLPGYQPTPLYSLPVLASTLGIGELFVKDESERMGLKAFKVLGASYAISKMMDNLPQDVTFCAATDGNHGKAVAWASKIMGKKAVIFMPQSTVEARVRSIENEGAEVFIVRGNYDDTVKAAIQHSEKNGWCLIQDTSWDGYTDIPANIMAGYTTILREMENSVNTPGEPAFDTVILKAGVGSWAATAVWYFHERYGKKRPKIILVEPTSADCCMEAMKNDKVIPTGKPQDTIMAGLNCGTASKIAFEILREGVDLFISIPDWYAGAAMNALYYVNGEDPQIISGESGSAGLGGLMALQKEASLQEAKKYIGIDRYSRVLIFNTEGNTDPVNFNRIIHEN